MLDRDKCAHRGAGGKRAKRRLTAGVKRGPGSRAAASPLAGTHLRPPASPVQARYVSSRMPTRTPAGHTASESALAANAKKTVGKPQPSTMRERRKTYTHAGWGVEAPTPDKAFPENRPPTRVSGGNDPPYLAGLPPSANTHNRQQRTRMQD